MKIFLLLIISIFAFSSCQTKDKYIKENLAEIREFLYEGSNEEVKATLVCGKRESEYVLNGYATSLVEFGVLTFYIQNIDDYSIENKKYALIVGTKRIEGVLEKNPFDNTLVADIKKIIDSDEKISVKLVLDDFTCDLKLKKVNSDWRVSANDVISIISNSFESEIRSLVENGILKGEVYIKIINDEDEYANDYYWYVSILSRNGEKLNAIISPKSGEILTKSSTIQTNKN